MEKFPISEMALKNPCKQDCPRRKGGCAAECPEWIEYETEKFRRYAERQARLTNNQVTADAERRIRRDARNQRLHRKHMR